MIFTPARQREYRLAALIAMSAFFTLTGYEFIRSASTVLFKRAYGADNLPVVMAMMPVVIFCGVALYGRILSSLGPRRTLLTTTLGSGFIIFLCYLAVVAGSRAATAVLYLVREFYIVLLIEQYWSYINSSLSADTAKKINGPITGIAGLGGALGGWLLSVAAEPLGTESMVLIAAVSVIPAALVSAIAYASFGDPKDYAERSTKGHMGWSLFADSRLLRYLLAIVLTSQVVSAVLELKFQSLLSTEYAGQTDRETAFQGRFFSTLNTSVLLLQFIVAPLLLNFLRFRLVHVLMPLVHLGAITIAVIEPTIFTVGMAFFLFKAFDYSVFRAAKEILYIPLSFDVRFRAKEVIDVLGYRTGKGASSVVIVLLQRIGVVMSNYYTAVALVAAGIWLLLIFPLTRDAENNLAARSAEPDGTAQA